MHIYTDRVERMSPSRTKGMYHTLLKPKMTIMQIVS